MSEYLAPSLWEFYGTECATVSCPNPVAHSVVEDHHLVCGVCTPCGSEMMQAGMAFKQNLPKEF